jgi:hypothetical protein
MVWASLAVIAKGFLIPACSMCLLHGAPTECKTSFYMRLYPKLLLSHGNGPCEQTITEHSLVHWMSTDYYTPSMSYGIGGGRQEDESICITNLHSWMCCASIDHVVGMQARVTRLPH